MVINNTEHLSKDTYVITDSVEHDVVYLTTSLRHAIRHFCRLELEREGGHDLTCMDIHRNGLHCNLMNWYEADLLNQ